MRSYKTLGYALVVAGVLAGCGSSSDVVEEENLTTTQETDTTEIVDVVKKIDGWYMRTTVEATTPSGRKVAHNTAGVFGELKESEAGEDKHDVPSAGTAELQVLFVNKELNETKQYFSDYRHYNEEESPHQAWTFTVNNTAGEDLSGVDFSLNVEALRELTQEEKGNYREVVSLNQSKRESLSLIDLDNNETYSYASAKEKSFNMDEKHIRAFRWVLGEIEASDYLYDTNSSTAKVVRVEKSSASHFGTPPSF